MPQNSGLTPAVPKWGKPGADHFSTVYRVLTVYRLKKSALTPLRRAERSQLVRRSIRIVGNKSLSVLVNGLHHGMKTIGTSHGKMITQTNILDEVRVCIQHLLG